MRAAGLDLTEQGDVWARVHHHRATHPTQPPDAHTWNRFTHQVRHLITGQLRTTNDWHTTFTTAGTDLQHLRATGRLTRGIRTVIALHVIFHWNRIGIPAATQATLAHAGKKPSSMSTAEAPRDAGISRRERTDNDQTGPTQRPTPSNLRVLREMTRVQPPVSRYRGKPTREERWSHR